MIQKKIQHYQFNVVGLSYQKADAEIRGKFTLFPNQVQALSQFFKQNGVHHFFAVSTCNRTEIYAANTDSKQISQLYCDFLNIPAQEFNQYSFALNGQKAVEHFFNVSAGLDSQIIGDFEVVMQVKLWAKRFKQCKTLNAFLERLINSAIQISKTIKRETLISSGITSVSYAAVKYILDSIGQKKNQSIVLFGLGKIGRNTCENLVKHVDSKHITVINRTPEKGIALQEKHQVRVKPITELEDILATTNILVVATGATQPTITKEMIGKQQDILILDLSIPQNVAKDVNDLSHATVVNVDELSSIINQTFHQRKAEIPKAKAIIQQHSQEFYNWLENRVYAEEILAFKQKLLFLQNHELKNLKKSNANINGKETILAEQLVQKLTNRFASHLLDNQSKAKESIALVNEIFKLDLRQDSCD